MKIILQYKKRVLRYSLYLTVWVLTWFLIAFIVMIATAASKLIVHEPVIMSYYTSLVDPFTVMAWFTVGWMPVLLLWEELSK